MLKNSKTRNFIIAIILLLGAYLLIVFLTENDNDFTEDLPVSNMKSTINNDIDNILKDVNTSLYTGFSNIIFNMENVKIFDDENTSVFTELYKMCQEKNGKFILVKISDSVKEALSDAFLDNLILTSTSIENAVSIISN